MVETNGKIVFYLKVIGIGAGIIVLLMGFTFGSAVVRNDKAHDVLGKHLSEKADQRDLERMEKAVIRLVDKIQVFIEHAPPRHIHTDDKGEVTRVVP